MRPGRVLLFAALFSGAAITNGSLGKTAPLVSTGNAAGPAVPLILVAEKKASAARTRAQQCKALNKCRWYYAHCEKKVYGAMKPGAKRDAAKEACVSKYRSCIKKAFPNGGFLFERWFMPGECK